MTRREGPRIDYGPGHFHPEYWTEEDHHRFEAWLTEELKGIKSELRGLANRVTLLLGGIALIGFLLPIVAPFIRGLLNIPTQP